MSLFGSNPSEVLALHNTLMKFLKSSGFPSEISGAWIEFPNSYTSQLYELEQIYHLWCLKNVYILKRKGGIHILGKDSNMSSNFLRRIIYSVKTSTHLCHFYLRKVSSMLLFVTWNSVSLFSKYDDIFELFSFKR